VRQRRFALLRYCIGRLYSAWTAPEPFVSRILVLSSWVSFGHVGMSAAVPVLQALGHDVTQLPTTVLSNHRAWPLTAGGPVPPEQLTAMSDAIEANGWLADHDAFLAGYLPSPEQVGVACDLVERLRHLRPRIRVVVDPVLGDDPIGLYLDEATAGALRERLVPLADILTPNRFELGWLTGLPVDTLERCRTAGRELMAGQRKQTVFVTSPPLGSGETGVLVIAPAGDRLYQVPRLPGVPHGTGDVFSALIASGLDVSGALGHLKALIEASAGSAHLEIVGSLERWRGAGPIKPARIGSVSDGV
jgi:pyridoxine kinase